MAVRRSWRWETDAGEALVRSIFEQHGRALLAYASRLAQDRASAEYIVEEALVRAWKHRATLPCGKLAVRLWLFAVVSEVLADMSLSRPRAKPRSCRLRGGRTDRLVAPAMGCSSD
jgi:RNA polymerase sigma-70 factor (ECF subfamily)